MFTFCYAAACLACGNFVACFPEECRWVHCTCSVVKPWLWYWTCCLGCSLFSYSHFAFFRPKIGVLHIHVDALIGIHYNNNTIAITMVTGFSFPLLRLMEGLWYPYKNKPVYFRMSHWRSFDVQITFLKSRAKLNFLAVARWNGGRLNGCR